MKFINKFESIKPKVRTVKICEFLKETQNIFI